MSLEGRQQTNQGYLEAQAFANDPDNETAPTPSFLEKELGVNAYGLAQIGTLLTGTANIPTADQKAALDAASSPSALNAIATIEDLAAFSSPTSFFYDFNATAGVPASGEIRMDDADADLATVVRLHNLNRSGANVGNIMMKISSNDAIIIQDNLEGDKVYNFDVTGSPTQVGGTGASGYVEVPVSLFSQGATEITSSDVVVAGVYQDGNNTAFLRVSNNLSDVNNAATARSNIGAGTGNGDMVGSNNLSEITTPATARTNLGFDQGVNSTDAPTFANNTTIGDSQFGDGYIELNINGSGDRNSYLDFWAHGAADDYDSRIIRTAGVNADWNFQNRGSGKMKFWNEVDGGGFEFNSQLNDNDWAAYGTLANRNIYYDADTGRFGINDTTPSYELDVNGEARFVSGLKATTIDNTNSIDGGAITANTIDGGAIIAGTLPPSAVAQTTFICYVDDAQTAATKTDWESVEVGTRLDVTDGAFNASSFEFDFTGFIEKDVALYGTSLKGKLVKDSGSGDVRVLLQAAWGDRSGVYNPKGPINGGTLTTAGSTVVLPDDGSFSSQIGSITIERRHISNELSFRLTFTGGTTTEATFRFGISGPRAYTGTLITSSLGTIV